jgi:hypothetical protein
MKDIFAFQLIIWSQKGLPQKIDSIAPFFRPVHKKLITSIPINRQDHLR